MRDENASEYFSEIDLTIIGVIAYMVLISSLEDDPSIRVRGIIGGLRSYQESGMTLDNYLFAIGSEAKADLIIQLVNGE